jgi:hypothetical protein
LQVKPSKSVDMIRGHSKSTRVIQCRHQSQRNRRGCRGTQTARGHTSQIHVDPALGAKAIPRHGGRLRPLALGQTRLAFGRQGLQERLPAAALGGGVVLLQEALAQGQAQGLGQGHRAGMVAPRDLGQAGLGWGLAGLLVAGHGLVLPLQAGLDQAIDGRQRQRLPPIEQLAAVAGPRLIE